MRFEEGEDELDEKAVTQQVSDDWIACNFPLVFCKLLQHKQGVVNCGLVRRARLLNMP